MKVLVPKDLRHACDLLDNEPDAVPLAGATDVLAHWPTNLPAHDRTYLDLSGLTSLQAIGWTEQTLTLGALTTYWDVLCNHRVCDEFPLLPAAARQVGAIQIQSRGTWAGNIANASPAADGVPVLMAYDAVVVLTSSHGTQRVPLCDYYTGYRQSVRQPQQLLTAIEIPRRPYTFAVFQKVGPRRAQAITKVGVAITAGEGGWRVVANSVAPTVRRCRAVEVLLDNRQEISSPHGFAEALAADVSPIDDIRSTALYRRTVLANLIYHELIGVYPGVT